MCMFKFLHLMHLKLKSLRPNSVNVHSASVSWYVTYLTLKENQLQENGCTLNFVVWQIFAVMGKRKKRAIERMKDVLENIATKKDVVFPIFHSDICYFYCAINCFSRDFVISLPLVIFKICIGECYTC